MTTTTSARQPTALVTGASAGLGRALATALAERGWTLVLDARGSDRLDEVVTDPVHRAELAAAVRWHGRLDLLVHNASELGGSPQPRLDALDPQTFASVLDTNVVAPAALTRELLPELVAARGAVLAVSSDAAVEHYEGWGAYGASKAALDHLVGTFAAEQPSVRWYAVDPGDMRTAMHQAAFPGEDISDRPLPETVVPALLRLLDESPASGRYRASDYATAEVVA
jgi:NAD(P)-dependent dehydrogenase (short-subunit alcohol dehydrogenase family)